MIFRYLLSLTLLFSLFTLSLPQIGYAQTSTAQTASDYSKQLASIEEKVEKRRKELGIPGIALGIVKDGQVIYLKGFGHKDFEKQVPVTPETQFAIGSATKAFTALSILMSADEGKVSLDDSPKKYLPYFKMKDAEADKNITVRDLMTHASGINRTDLAMITGQLNRQELIQVIGEAEPMAKLREKFFYNNIMFAAAGEITAKVQKTTWEKFVPEKIFKPLGMNNSTMTIPQLMKSKDYSLGYEYNFETKETRRLPFRLIDATNPAGSINSSARDMTKWLQFVIDGGVFNGKRLVSEKGYEEWVKMQHKVIPNGKVGYGLGWFLREWKGLKVVEHGGNIDGFNSQVAMIPEKKIGFVMLTNVSGSSLGNELMQIIWTTFLENPTAPKVDESVKLSPQAMDKLVGKYNFKEAGFEVEIKVQDGNLVAVVPNQPTYILKRVGERYFKLEGAPDGFFMKFTPSQGNATEIYLEQPQGNYTLPRSGKEVKKENSSSAKELIGKYLLPTGNGTVEIKGEPDDKVTFNIEGQPPYSLTEKAKDEFNLSPLSASYYLKVKRDAEGKVLSVVVVQPEGEFEFKKTTNAGNVAEKPQITVDELMKKAVEAAGGEANWRKITSRVTNSDVDLIHQGMKGSYVNYNKAPNKYAGEMTMTALGKVIAKGFEFFDGQNGEEIYTFSPVEKYAGKKLEDIRLGADFYGLLNWKTNFPKTEIKGTEKVGDEECYVVEFTPEKGTKVTEYYSTKTFLLLKRKGVSVSSTSDNSIPYSIVYSDYREVDGIKLPFKYVNSVPTMGDIVVITKSVKHNVSIDDKVFSPRKPALK